MNNLSKEAKHQIGWIEMSDLLAKMLIKRPEIQEICKKAELAQDVWFKAVFSAVYKELLKITFKENENGEPTGYWYQRAEKCPLCDRALGFGNKSEDEDYRDYEEYEDDEYDFSEPEG